jgi:hypothetical protein
MCAVIRLISLRKVGQIFFGLASFSLLSPLISVVAVVVVVVVVVVVELSHLIV